MQREVWQAAMAQRLQQYSQKNSLIGARGKVSPRQIDAGTVPISRIMSPVPIQVIDYKPIEIVGDIENRLLNEINESVLSKGDDDYQVTSISTSASPRDDTSKSSTFPRETRATQSKIKTLSKTRSSNILQTIAEHLGVHSSKVGITTSRSASRNNSEKSVYSARSCYLQDRISRRFTNHFSPSPMADIPLESIYSMKYPGESCPQDEIPDLG